jgi:prevent-host-death family protein
VTATRVPAELPISEARAILTDIATAAKEHGATTTLTKHGKPYAKVVPLDHPPTPDPEMWRAARDAYDKAITTGLSNANPVIVEVLTEFGRLLNTYFGDQGQP